MISRNMIPFVISGMIVSGVFAANCYVNNSAQSVCCTPVSEVCRKKNEQGTWVTWSCTSTIAGGGPFSVGTVSQATVGQQGHVATTTTVAGTCTLTSVTCGPNINSCVTVGTFPLTCNNELEDHLDSSTCFGQQN